ncbi:MAG: 2-iminoacetate synthase ThiH [Candidatus Omnitrophica bacterium]|nr:2-iminoacetate synthase ThiH [Candidatus Omnitrophota bacterium]
MISLNEIKDILSNDDPAFLEMLAQNARSLTEQYFGRTVTLYAPIYISNYCSSHCTYCGFHNHHKIKRFKLSLDQIKQEMQFIASKKIRNILILTGESYEAAPVSYIKEAVLIAQKYFSGISLEIHPLNEAEYLELFLAGADGLTIYQETFDRIRYQQVHLAGRKKDYDFRFHAPERAAQAGFRQISIGALLGLSELAPDLLALYEYLQHMEKNFPGVEYSVSFPRLRPIKGENFSVCDINDLTFVKIICLTRTLFPRVGINLSTRETAFLRDHLVGTGITRISAGSNTAVGGYTVCTEEEASPQFDVNDDRSVDEIINMLKSKNFDPVFTDWRSIKNESI